MQKIHVFHLDDDQIALNGTASLLRDIEDIVYQGVSTVPALYALLNMHDGNFVLLLDLNLNSEVNKGFVVLEKVKRDFPACKVIILSGNVGEEIRLMDLALKEPDAIAVKSIQATPLYALIKNTTQAPEGFCSFYLPKDMHKVGGQIEAWVDILDIRSKKERYNRLHLSEKIIFKLACWGLVDEEIADICFRPLKTLQRQMYSIATEEKLAYPRKAFHVFANLIGIDYRDFSEITSSNISPFYGLLIAEDIEKAYIERAESKEMKENIRDFLHTVQREYLFLNPRP